MKKTCQKYRVFSVHGCRFYQNGGQFDLLLLIWSTLTIWYSMYQYIKYEGPHEKDLTDNGRNI